MFCMSEAISSFKSLRAGSQVFALLMLPLCGRVSCYASFPLVCCACLPSAYVCKYSVGLVYAGGYGGLNESGLCVFREVCPVSFLVVGESPLVLL